MGFRPPAKGRTTPQGTAPALTTPCGCPADAWVVRVEDTGAGLSADEIQRLFRPMESEKSDGMGLGLSISRAIVEGHAGAIWVEDVPLGGAAFCFSLPVRVESEELEQA